MLQVDPRLLLALRQRFPGVPALQAALEHLVLQHAVEPTLQVTMEPNECLRKLFASCLKLQAALEHLVLQHAARRIGPARSHYSSNCKRESSAPAVSPRS